MASVDASPPASLGATVQPWPPPSKLTFDAIRDFMVTNGKEFEVEFLVAVDRDGQIVQCSKGSRSSTGLSKTLQNALLDPNSYLIVHHNHPSGSPLTRWDLAFLAFPGLSTIVAHTSARLTSLASLSTRGHQALNHVLGHFGEYYTFLELYDALDLPFSFDEDVQEEVFRGLIDVDEANRCNKLALFAAMNRSGLFIVDSDFALPSLFHRADIQLGIDEMADQIARRFDSTAVAR